MRWLQSIRECLNKAIEFARSNSSGKTGIILLYVISKIGLPLQYDQSGLALPESPGSKQHLIVMDNISIRGISKLRQLGVYQEKSTKVQHDLS